ncbi:DUF3306 domain-containing protein [Limnohabitans sp. Rim8]|uniref:DUF3306 domain-containing protein n=1 Tax=Limnohabitans sp. Rim8 TaxID=1100718 RepID=UPI002636EE85|nr:DUF3306 domain-containing protein [Limnohabitans sp. Rim8]
MSDHFFSRWSRRKQGLETTESVPPKTDNSQAMAVGGQAHLPSQSSVPPAAGAVDATAAPDPAAQRPPLPTLEDARALTPSSDFQPFMQQGVAADVRNTAVKKLFTDPHFNVMDGLDIYIGDYNTPDPLPPGMLQKMVGAQFLNLFPSSSDATANSENPAVPLGNAAPISGNPDESPALQEGSADVAQSPQSLDTPDQQHTAAPTTRLAPEHDHPDLQLQPNHAPASPSPGQSTG